MYFATEKIQSWITLKHQARLLMQICFHFDANCITEITGDTFEDTFEIFAPPISIISLDIEDNIGAARKCLALLFLFPVTPVMLSWFFIILFSYSPAWSHPIAIPGTLDFWKLKSFFINTAHISGTRCWRLYILAI